ncbi:MAG: lasso peptide biosynthesis protein [Thermoanaerobaculia bacterium]|nr:lasso peptide biosynthesis protein [Thermoanaerobaculia bacterium]
MKKVLFALIAWPLVVRASVRAAWWVRRLPLDEATTRLRVVPDLPGWLRRPRWLAALADRLLPFLPPYGYGPCFKRSLWLLDLWARCGLEPKIHLGMYPGQSPSTQPRELHAWITAGPLSTPSDHEEIWCG